MDSTIPRSSMVRMPSTAASRMARNRASLSPRDLTASSFCNINSIFSVLLVRALFFSRDCSRAFNFDLDVFCWFFTPKRKNYGQNGGQFQLPRIVVQPGPKRYLASDSDIPLGIGQGLS